MIFNWTFIVLVKFKAENEMTESEKAQSIIGIVPTATEQYNWVEEKTRQLESQGSSR